MMTLYDRAVMLAGQFSLVLVHSVTETKAGRLAVDPGASAVYIHPSDVPKKLRC